MFLLNVSLCSFLGMMNLVTYRIFLFMLDVGKFKAKHIAYFQQIAQYYSACIVCTPFALVFILFSYPCFLFALIASSLSCC